MKVGKSQETQTNRKMNAESPKVQFETLESRTLMSVAPLTAVSISTSNGTVYYSVYDPTRGATIYGSYAPGGTISNLVVNGGVVAYNFTVPSPFNTVGVGYAIYDPNSGSWKPGYNSGAPGGNTFSHTATAPQVANGVVACIMDSANYSTANYSEAYFATYNPAAGAWTATDQLAGSTSKTVSDYEQNITTAQGLVAWQQLYENVGFSSLFTLGCAYFNPARSAWVIGGSNYSTLPSAPSISGNAINYAVSGVGYSLGANPAANNFTSGASLPYASFFATPTAGQNTFNSWYWDESIGGSSWSWSFGDGGTSGSQSGYHTYQSFGTFSLTQTIAGPRGSSAVATPVTDNPPGLTATTGSQYTLLGSTGAKTLSITAGTVTLTSDLSASLSNYAMEIQTGASVVLQSNQHVDALQLAGTGSLNVNSFTLFDTYGTTADPISTIDGYLASGYANGAWNGAGLTSTSAQSNQDCALGSADGAGGTVAGLASNEIEIKFTYYGDSNLTGNVDGSDYSLIDSGYLGHQTGWYNGDLNYDGVINGSDYTLIDNAFNTQGVSLADLIASPEAKLAAPNTTTSPTAIFSHVRLAMPPSWTDADADAVNCTNFELQSRRNIKRFFSDSQFAVTLAI